MTGFKKDILGDLPQQLQSANDQLKQFLGTFQSFMGAMGQVTGQLGTTINRVSDQAGVKTPTFLTPKGQNAHSDFLDNLSSKMAGDAYDRAVGRKRAGEGTSSDGRIAFDTPIAQVGTVSVHTMPTGNRSKAIHDLRNQIRQGLEGAYNGDQSFNSSIPNRTNNSYSMADLPRVMSLNTSKMDTQLTKTIDNLKQSDDVNNKAVVRVLEDIKKELGGQAREFAKARDAFVMAADSGDRNLKDDSQRKLLDTLSKLEQSFQDAEMAKKGISPGGMGGGGGSIGEKLKGMAAPVGAVLGLGAAAYGFYSQVANGQDEILMNAPINKARAQANIANYSFRGQMESHDMNNAENIIRYRGNMLLPSYMQGSFTGDRNALANSLHTSAEASAIGIDIEKRQRTGGIINGLTGLAGTALKMAGGAVALTGGGALPGLGLMGLGQAAETMSGATNQSAGIAGGYLNSPYTLYSGDFKSGLSGMVGGFRRGSQFDRLADQATEGARLQKYSEMLQRGREVQNLELQQRQPMVMGAQGRLDLIQTRKQGSILVGEYAQNELNYLTGGSSGRLARLGYNSGGLYNEPESQVRATNVIRQVTDPFGTISNLPTQRILPNRITPTQLATINANSTPSHPYDSMGMGLAASLEMSPSEFLSSQNLLTNYLGSRVSGGSRAASGLGYQGLVASQGATANMVRLGRSGLGSFEELLGNVGSLNQTIGGQDNTKSLEVVLSQAVAAGFDKSRTSQKFVQTTTQIAESLKLTNIANTSAVLGTTSRLTSGTGIADERSLKVAAEGIQAYGAFTGQTSGISGALTAIGAANAGFSYKNGANIVSGLSAPQMADFIKTLHGTGPIADMNLNALVQLNGGDRSKVAAMLSATRDTTTTTYSSTLEQSSLIHGKSFGGVVFDNKNNFFKKLRDLPKQQAQAAIKALMPAVTETFAATKTGSAGGAAFLGEELEINNMGEYKNLTDMKKASGNAKFIDVGNQQRLNFIENVVKDFTASDQEVGVDKKRDIYFRSLKDNIGATRQINYNGKMVSLTEQSYNKGNSEFKKAADDEFKKMDQFDLVRGLQDKAIQESNAQPVKIMNLNDLIEVMYRAAQLESQGSSKLPRSN